MNNYKSINEIRDNFGSIRKILDKSQLDKVLGFDNKKDLIFSFFGIRHNKYLKLINDGALVFVYTYKITYEMIRDEVIYKTWNIYSPIVKYEENPEEYSKISAKLESFLKNDNKKYRRIIRHLKNNENEFTLLELPSEEFDNEKVYISTITSREKVTPDIKNGINVALINQSISKKLYFLPFYFLEDLKRINEE